MTSTVCIVVMNHSKAQKLQRMFDPKVVTVIAYRGPLLGARFTNVINTVRFEDFESAMDKTEYLRWVREDLPLKLLPGGVLSYTD